MIKCLVDVTLPPESKCAKCCIYCDKANSCAYTCENVLNGWNEDKVITECIEAYEDL